MRLPGRIPRGKLRVDAAGMTLLLPNGRTVDLRVGSVTDAAGQVAMLRPQTAEVLNRLAARLGALVTKDELMQAVWPGVAVTDDSLVQCIKEIRQAIGDDKHHVITTVVKRGYVFRIEASPKSTTLNAAAVGGAQTTGNITRKKAVFLQSPGPNAHCLA